MDALDELQQEKLAQFQAITQMQDIDEAIGQLLDCDWNLERAIQNVYDNKAQDKREQLEEEVASSAPPPPVSSSSSSNTRQPPQQRQPASFIMRLLYWPIGLAWNITLTLLSIASRLIYRPAITHRQREPRLLATEFINTFEAKYGSTHVDFFRGGYSQALEKARRELRFMLVLLQSDDHDETDSFCKETLVSSRVIDFVKEKNILVWAGNVHESEAHKVSYTLKATTYPFMALIALQNSVGTSTPKMTVIERMEGPSHPEELVSQVEIAIERHGAVVNRLKNEREQRELERRLREDQDKAYHESLKADQEKARKAQEEEKAKRLAEQEAENEEKQRELLKQKREQYIDYLYAALPDEPTEGKMAKISFRLADGDRVIRKFREDTTVKSLYEFVQVYPLLKENKSKPSMDIEPQDYNHEFKFTIHSPFPRTEYGLDNTDKLCDIKSLWPSATLVVDAVDDEED
ncbi:UBX-domain-containing protein, partial [Backusella circina FSU 941]